MRFESEIELLSRAQEAEGMSFYEIDRTGRIDNEKAKGHLGQIIEESFFGYEVNSNAEADFAELGIELKVTPVKELKNGQLSAKERLVLNIIDFHKEALNSFEDSSFWRKNESLLLMFYKWLPDIPRGDYRILKSHLHRFSESDLQVIRNDWSIIVAKIKAGQAHLISEGDTAYLSACTKGANRKSIRTQPFSHEPAMQRAFSLKASYMTTLIRELITAEHLVPIAEPDELQQKSLDQLLSNRFKKYEGMAIEDIAKEADAPLNTKSKSFLPLFVSSLLGVKGTSLEDIEEFSKANIKFKTVRLEPDGKPKEHMSFHTINFQEWINEEWETSLLRTMFEETKYLLVVFGYQETLRENPDRNLYFKGVHLWNMPMEEIEGRLKDFWLEGRAILEKGVLLKKTNRGISNNLPGPQTNGLCHVRPRARNAGDRIILPDGQPITKQAFWIDREYIGEITKELK
ncbi:Sau3AI family type II restriction endonuclease [Planococcus maitriensis]|uniref:Restriction endonuclease n=1 Tax=Planococcus maitriensis TaxID=221799 RepID=A0A365K8T9_9BACL|nr:Sau3AI family type II restriction endonuclease [Planococcus maitriensis]RAZ69178.1 restriction endonuclease [Planococcus maitriensis]